MKTKLGGFLICAAALAPMPATSLAARSDLLFAAAPLGAVIAAQGNQALREIRDEARLCLLGQKPAPPAAFKVRRNRAQPSVRISPAI